MVIHEPLRFTCVPWLSDAMDLRPAGEPVYAIMDPDHALKAWRIVSPWGRDDALLLIRAIRGDGTDGGVITASEAEAPPAPVAGITRPCREPDREDAA